MVRGIVPEGKQQRFAPTPWTEDSKDWQALDDQLPADQVLRQRLVTNAQKPSSKRKPAEKVLVSPADPDAILARDKFDVFRPLYSVQLLRDLDSPLIFAYDVLPQNNDNGVLEPMVERMVDSVGVKPEELLVDSGYVSIQGLVFCAAVGIILYGPCQENDYSMENEELLDALRERMKHNEAKCLYKLRSQTVELNHADMKEHRGLRRFHGRGLRRVTAEAATLVLAHNLFYVATHQRSARDPPTNIQTSPLPSAA